MKNFNTKLIYALMMVMVFFVVPASVSADAYNSGYGYDDYSWDTGYGYSDYSTNTGYGYDDYSWNTGYGYDDYSWDTGYGYSDYSTNTGYGYDDYSWNTGYGYDDYSWDTGYGYDDYSWNTGYGYDDYSWATPTYTAPVYQSQPITYTPNIDWLYDAYTPVYDYGYDYGCGSGCGDYVSYVPPTYYPPVYVPPTTPTLEVICRVSDRRPEIDERVTFTAEVSGGRGPFTYQWYGDVFGSGSSVTHRFFLSGQHYVYVQVTDRNGTSTVAECPIVRATGDREGSVTSGTLSSGTLTTPIGTPASVGSVYLNQVPYTGPEDTAKAIAFIVGILAWSIAGALIIRNRMNKNVISNRVAAFKEANKMTRG